MDPATIAAIAQIVAALMPYIIKGFEWFIKEILPQILDQFKKQGVADALLPKIKEHILSTISILFPIPVKA